MLKSTKSSSILLQRALKIAQAKPGELLEASLKKIRVLPVASLSDLSDTIKFVTSFYSQQSSPKTKIPSLVSTSLCEILPSVSLGSCSLRDHAHHPCTGVDESGFGRGRQREWIEELRGTGLCANDLSNLLEMCKEQGNTLSLESYTKLLKLCFSLLNNSPSGDIKGSKLHPAAVRLVRYMMQEFEKEEVKAAIYSSSLQVSTSPAQIDSIHKQFEGTSLEPDLNKRYLVEALLDTEATPRPSLSRLISRGDTPSPLTFEQLILSCVREYKLSRCIGVYSCMTRQYRMAPSRKVFSAVTRLLSETFQSDDQSQVWKLGLTSQLLADTLAAFDGDPPLWVYPEMAKPLSLLLGSDGYNQMLEASGEAVQEHCSRHSEESITDTLRELWTPSLYRSLIKCAEWTSDPALALDLLSDMRVLYLPSPPGHQLRWGATFNLLLGVVSSRQHLSSYLPTLLEDMTEILTPEEVDSLRVPLLRALERTHSSKTTSSPVYIKPHLRSQPHTHPFPLPDYVTAAADLLIDTAMQPTSHDQCISDLAHMDSQTVRTEVESDDSDDAVAV